MVHAVHQTEVDDLPPRDWRGWWLAWPKWFRIACWAAFGVLVLHAAVAVRICIGLIEPAPIQALRRPGVHVIYQSNRYGQPFPGYNRMLDGIKGISCNDVIAIRLDEHGTDSDLELIGRNFPNLKEIYLTRSQVTATGLEKLRPCENLREIKLEETDVDDAVVLTLKQFPNLNRIDLSGTLVSDAILALLQNLPGTECTLNVYYTDVTLEAIKAMRPMRNKVIQTELDRVTTGILGSIRWSDGSRSGRFAGNYELRVSGPIIDGRSTGSFAQMSSKLTRRTMWWDTQQFQGRTDGEYHFTAKLGGIESAPAVVKIQAGQADVDHVEFRMPCTMAEAMQSALK